MREIKKGDRVVSIHPQSARVGDTWEVAENYSSPKSICHAPDPSHDYCVGDWVLPVLDETGHGRLLKPCQLDYADEYGTLRLGKYLDAVRVIYWREIVPITRDAEGYVINDSCRLSAEEFVERYGCDPIPAPVDDVTKCVECGEPTENRVLSVPRGGTVYMCDDCAFAKSPAPYSAKNADKMRSQPVDIAIRDETGGENPTLKALYNLRSYENAWLKRANPISYMDVFLRGNLGEPYVRTNDFGVQVTTAPFSRKQIYDSAPAEEWPTPRDIEECCGVWLELNEWEKMRHDDYSEDPDAAYTVRQDTRVDDFDHILAEFVSRDHFDSSFATCKRIEPLGAPKNQPETAAQRERREAREKWSGITEWD